MSVVSEFKEFAVRGNVVDLAVGVVVGGAFGKIVTSLVNDIIMPLAGLLPGNIDLSNRFVNLSSTHYDTIVAAKAAAAPTLNYGLFLNSVIDFLIVAVAIFFFIKQINRLKREPEKSSPTTKKCPYCAEMIPLEAKRCGRCTSNL